MHFKCNPLTTPALTQSIAPSRNFGPLCNRVRPLSSPPPCPSCPARPPDGPTSPVLCQHPTMPPALRVRRVRSIGWTGALSSSPAYKGRTAKRGSHKRPFRGPPGDRGRGIAVLPSMGIEPTTLGLLDPRSNQLSYDGGNGIQRGPPKPVSRE